MARALQLDAASVILDQSCTITEVLKTSNTSAFVVQMRSTEQHVLALQRLHCKLLTTSVQRLFPFSNIVVMPECTPFLFIMINNLLLMPCGRDLCLQCG